MSLPPASIGVQHLGLQRLVLGTRRVELAHARVQVPAVVVELARDALHVGERLLLEVQEAHHHVGHLDAGVVDVVLDAHVEAAVAQQPHERVAEAGVAQVADVGGLVRVDARVLDDDVPRTRCRRGRLGERAVQDGREAAAVQEQVDVAPAGDLGPANVARGRELSRRAARRSRAACAAASWRGRKARSGPGRRARRGADTGRPRCLCRCRKRPARPALPPPKGAVGDPGSQQSILPCACRGLRDFTSFDQRWMRAPERVVASTMASPGGASRCA